MRYIFLLLFICSGLAFGQNNKIDSLKKVIETTKVDTVKGRSLCRLCEQLWNVSDYEKGLKKGQEGLALCEKAKDRKGMADCLLIIGTVYGMQSNYPKALECFEKNWVIREQIGDKMGIANSLNNIGNIYIYQSNYSQALDFYQKSLTIREQIGDKVGKAKCLGNIGVIYDLQGNFSKALEYQQYSLKLQEQMRDLKAVSVSLNNIGNLYDSQKNYPKAMEYYQKSLQLYEQIDDTSGIANCFNNIGTIYSDHYRNYPNALDYFQKALLIWKQIGDTAGISVSASNLGTCYLYLNQPQTAVSYARKGLQLAQQINHSKWMELGAWVSFQVDSALGDWKSAFEHHKLYKQYSDSLNNEEKAKEFGKIESKYEFETQAEAEKRTQQIKAQKENAEKERRNNLQYLTIFAGIIGLFTGLLFIGKLKIPTKITEVFIFAGLLITFEFLLIFFDPYFEKYSGGIPFYKLGFNTLIAFGFAPLHSFLESKLKRRLFKENER